jgi:hypothetical protein
MLKIFELVVAACRSGLLHWALLVSRALAMRQQEVSSMLARWTVSWMTLWPQVGLLLLACVLI